MAYRRYYRSRKYNASPKEAKYDLYGKFDAISYLQKEFFNLDEGDLEKSFALYKSLYGAGPYKYLRTAYYSWKHGHVQPSPQSLHRIIECVPPFLSFDKRFFILKSEIYSFARASFGGALIKSSRELEAFYNYSANKINEFSNSNLFWFVGKGIIDEQGANTIIAYCRFVLLSKLNQETRLLALTLPEISNELSASKNYVTDATYHVRWFNLTALLLNEFSETQILFKEPILPVRQLHDSLTSYVIDACLEMMKNETYELSGNSVAQNQIQLSRNVIQEICKTNFEAEINQNFSTAIGDIRISYKVESLVIILKSAVSQMLEATLLAIIPCIILYVLLVKITNPYPLLLLLISIASIVSFIKSFRKGLAAVNTFSNYGKQRKRSFAYRQY